MSDVPPETEEQFEAALAVAERFLRQAREAAPDLGDFVVVAMIEAAVNGAVDVAGEEDIAALLRDLADQIEGKEEASGPH